MKPVLCISQRVDVVQPYGERRDALDQQWAHFAHEFDLVLVPLANHAASARRVLEAVVPTGLILSGGNDLAVAALPGTAPERDALERECLAWAQAAGCPVLGVCRGFQAINLHCGGTLSLVTGHVACRHALTAICDAGPINVPAEVNSFHNFGISTSSLAPDIIAVAHAGDGSIEAFRHRLLPWYGIMWHPERERPFRNDDGATLQRIFGPSL